MSTYVHRIVQVKVSDKWETVKVYTDYSDKKHIFKDKIEEFNYKTSLPITLNSIYLENINDYCDNLCGLRDELYRRFEDQPWDSDCPNKEIDSYNHCWATLKQLDAWATELNNKFFEEMKNAYTDNKLNEILAILKKESFCPEDEYYDKVEEIKEYYYWDFLTLNNMINTAYTLVQQTHDIYNTNDIRILFYYD